MNRFALLLSLLLAVFLAWLYFESAPEPDLPPVQATRSDVDQVTRLFEEMESAVGQPPPRVYPEIIARPLFIAGRRPPKKIEEKKSESKPVAAPAPRAVKPRIKLQGIVQIGSEKFALVGFPREQALRRLKKGDSVEGWVLVDIRRDRLVLKSGDETFEVLLRQYKPVLPSKQVREKAEARKRQRKAARPAGKNGAGAGKPSVKKKPPYNKNP